LALLRDGTLGLSRVTGNARALLAAQRRAITDIVPGAASN
jgi:hypothetical protein